jgi:hypothetical protein
MGLHPAPIVHSVHFYETDEALIQRLGSIVLSGFREGISALLVMTDPHANQFRALLKRRGIDMIRAELQGQIFFADAEQTLARFMRDGMPDEQLFRESVGILVRTASAASKRTGLTAFGEMVAILWEQGNQEGALALEALWNGLLEEECFHLHCAYPKSLFKAGKGADLRLICDEHSLAVGMTNAA